MRPVGESKPRRVDVRVIAATARDLEVEVAAGRFREDLFYRLDVVRVQVPPLRERREDIPLLVDHFLGRTRESLGKARAQHRRRRPRAPGRLRLAGQRARARERPRARGHPVRAATASPSPTCPRTSRPLAAERRSAARDLSLRRARRAVEARLIGEALEATGGNRTHAARLLGISHRALLYKLKEYGLGGREA